MIEDLTAIAEEMAGLLQLFRNGGNMHGLILPTEHAATFKSRAIEAKTILDEELGRANEYSLNLLAAVNSGSGFVGGPSYVAVEETSKIIRAGVRTILRKRAQPPAPSLGSKDYVDPARIVALQGIADGKWDFKRLIELCRELNVAAGNRCHMSTAMVLRTILNHVPPVLGFSTFAEVANNYGGARSMKSFKASMQRLEGSLRNIADMHLHSPIRAREDVPTAVQVDFAADLDVLLGELLRVAYPERQTS
jgi:hypothetical protein